MTERLWSSAVFGLGCAVGSTRRALISGTSPPAALANNAAAILRKAFFLIIAGGGNLYHERVAERLLFGPSVSGP